MKLTKYLSDNALTDEAFGRLVGKSQSQINRIKRGVSKPSLDLANLITKVTGGKVSPASFFTQDGTLIDIPTGTSTPARPDRRAQA
ncbi:helix-turn-helix transcriptional regulator [Corticibacterium sp. UT-5YL-CI-8]|nr:helix-turn-helix transcriptional regulator [Tianweitania sp. UT-5YL-CI-8]